MLIINYLLSFLGLELVFKVNPIFSHVVKEIVLITEDLKYHYLAEQYKSDNYEWDSFHHNWRENYGEYLVNKYNY